jgi:ribosome biogenesis GTPase
MFALSSGGLVIDTPGMRKLQLWDIDTGLSAVFDGLDEIAVQCRYRDCSHQLEPGCAVRIAVEAGQLDPGRVTNFLKLRAEQASLERKVDLRAAREAKKRARLASNTRSNARRHSCEQNRCNGDRRVGWKHS